MMFVSATQINDKIFPVIISTYILYSIFSEFRENEAPKSAAYTPQTIPHHTYADPQQGQHHNRRQNGTDPLNGYVINPGGHQAAYDNNGFLPDNRHSEGRYNPGMDLLLPGCCTLIK